MDQAEVTAAGWAGVSVISNSWGEGEFSGETSEDSSLITPTGHQGSRSWLRPETRELPRVIPRILRTLSPSAGPTSKFRAAAATSAKAAWSSGGGGISTVEAIRQLPVRTQWHERCQQRFETCPTSRPTRDPNSGVYVYDMERGPRGRLLPGRRDQSFVTTVVRLHRHCQSGASSGRRIDSQRLHANAADALQPAQF